MSLKTETFHAVKCDYPGCQNIWDADEYTYSTDPYGSTMEMRDEGWCISETLGDFCTAHTELAEHDPGKDGDCTRCEDICEPDELCAKPFSDSPEDQLRVMVRDITERAHRSLDVLKCRVDRELGVDRYPNAGTLSGRTGIALNKIHRLACLAVNPKLNSREIHLMQEAAA